MKKEGEVFLDLIILLTLVGVIIASILFLAPRINDIRNEIVLMVEEINAVASELHDVTKLIIDLQKGLNEKMNALERFLDAHYTNVGIQQNHFNALAKADMVMARRNELVRAKELKVALDRLMSSALVSRQPPASNDVLALENITKRIKELEIILKDR